MNAAAPNISLLPTSATDLAMRSSGTSSAKQDPSTTSFADSLKSARASDANSAPEKKEASKANTPHTSGVIPSKPSSASSSNASDSDTTTSQTDDASQTTADASQSQVKITTPVPLSAGADAVSQKPAAKLQATGNNIAAQSKDLEAAETAETASSTTGVHAGDAKTTKKQTASHNAQTTADNKQPQTQDVTAAALVTVAQPVQAVVVTPTTGGANQNTQSKPAMTLPNVSGKASKISAASASAQQVAAPAADPNVPVPANAGAADETVESVEGTVEGSTFADKIIAATGSQHAALNDGGLDVTQQGATFSYSLHNAASLHQSTGDSSKSAIDTKTVATQDDTNVTAQFTAVVRRLEVSVNDPVLGNVDVRAEMRGGALHASISGPQANTAAAAELHQFLQQHQVAVHTVSFQNTADALRSTAPSSASTFSNSDSGSRENAQGSGSNASQQQSREGSQERNQFLDDHLSGTAYGTTSNRLASSQVSASMLTPQSSGGNLSIHI